MRGHLGQRLEHKSPLVQTRVWNMQTRFVDHLGIVEKQIEIECPRHPSGGLGGPIPAAGLLDAMKFAEKFAWSEFGIKDRDSVEIRTAGVLPGEADRGGLADRGAGRQTGLWDRGKGRQRGDEVRGPIAEVGPDRDGGWTELGQST